MTALSFGLLVFGTVWTTVRFSSAFGHLTWMQRAYDEPFYFWQLQMQVAKGSLELNYRFLSELLGAALLSMGFSLDVVATAYGIVNPILVFIGALFLASVWEKRSVARVVWALVLVLSYDLLSGSSKVLDYEPLIEGLTRLVNNLALLEGDIATFFNVQRRPEPQTSWIVFFPYLAALLGSFLNGRRGLYLGVCVATPFLVLVYINLTIVGLLLFAMLSFLSLVVYRRPVVVPAVLAIVVTLAAAAAVMSSGTNSGIADRSMFPTHLPFLRPSIVLALGGLAWAGWQIRRNGTTPHRWAALVFFSVPLITLNQQIVTGLAVMPQTWEFNANYLCLAIGIGLMSANVLSSLEEGSDWKRFVPLGLWAIICFLVIRGELRSEASWLAENARSVVFKDLYGKSTAKVGPVDAVILPHVFDESMFVARTPMGTKVLGGYNSLLLDPAPAWRPGESFEDHATAARAHFAAGFEVLFRSGVTPDQLRKNMLSEIATGDCWQALWYFFSVGDCWPRALNRTSPGTKLLPTAVDPIVEMYRHYLATDAARDLARRRVLLIRNKPLPADADGLIDNEPVVSEAVTVEGMPIEAYAYLQRPRPR